MVPSDCTPTKVEWSLFLWCHVTLTTLQTDSDVTISTRAVNVSETSIERSYRVMKLYQQHTQSILVFIYWFLPISHDSSHWRDHGSGQNASGMLFKQCVYVLVQICFLAAVLQVLVRSLQSSVILVLPYCHGWSSVTVYEILLHYITAF